ncbi:MAG TPA: glycosyltransferase, partial [Candidatus Binatia bacterium]
GRSEQNRPIIVFLGRMDYYPNVDGVLYFTNKILPLICARIPAIEFRIIGSNPAREVRRLAKIPGVIVTGHVPDVRPYLADAALSVAPLRMARGTQNKILESISMGLPVVATPQAAKGIQATSPAHLLVGNSPESFASAVINLLENPTMRACLSEAGRKGVADAHAWSASMNILDEILRTVELNRTRKQNVL